MYTPKPGEPGHYVEINGHPIFGYSRYINFYKDIVSYSARDDDLFVEVGSFLGQSTAALAAYVAASGKRIQIDAVDIFDISEFSDSPHAEAVEAFGGDLYRAFCENMYKAGISKYVNAIQSTSVEAAELYEDRSISYLMIDASHKYEDVVDDIRAWFPKIKIGGIICGDDFDWVEVEKASIDCFGRVSNQASTWHTAKIAETLDEQKALVINA